MRWFSGVEICMSESVCLSGFEIVILQSASRKIFILVLDKGTNRLFWKSI